MIARRSVVLIFALLGTTALATGAWVTRSAWLPLLSSDSSADERVEADAADTSSSPRDKVILSEQAQLNLGLVAKSTRPTTFWKTIQVPGMVVDRPGFSDRGVVAPATGVVNKILHYPGDSVAPGQPLFVLKLLSESLHQTQSDLFKTTQDVSLAKAQEKRMLGASGSIPEVRLIEIRNQIARLEVAAKAYRQELINRGFSSSQIDSAAEGKFIREISVAAPPLTTLEKEKLRDQESSTLSSNSSNRVLDPTRGLAYEVQDLKVELGQQAQAGQTLCTLSNHQLLNVEGRAFRDETALLERSVLQGWPVEIDFGEEDLTDWPKLEQTFRIQRLANVIDPINRTFAFQIPLVNQSRVVHDQGRTQMLWRFRPGQKVRIRVRVEKFENVFVVPAEAVAREGADAYVFAQNVNTFQRKPVHVLFRDRREVVLANDGSLVPGTFVTQSGAAQLNRIIKSASGGIPKGYHVHADGSLHKNEDEGK